MKIVNLASGSKGNCTFVKSGDTSVLIDAGISFSEIKTKLSSFGEDIFCLTAILVTHEHSDHIRGLDVIFHKIPTIQIYAHPSTMHEILKHQYLPIANQNPILQSDFYIGDLTVGAFSLSHDASHCLGFSFFENGSKFSIATDTGIITEALFTNLLDSNIVFLESNYDIDLLRECTKYPQNLKNRIASARGHLSNKDCASLIARLVKTGVKNFALGHISEHTNTPDLALRTTVDYLTAEGLLDNTISIGVLNQYEIGSIFEI